jgi:hypothetical protein
MVKRYRTFKKWGGANVIVLNQADVKDFELEHMDKVDISEIIVLKESSKNGTNKRQ